MRSLILALLITALSCGTAPTTLGDYCHDVGTTYCARLASCEAGVAGCLTTFETACCQGVDCNKVADGSKLTACQTAIEGLTCDALLNASGPPEACQ